jgi:selenocysteine-specific elongation factor
MKVIATAGHVDHGKSTLIQALTGIDPDRLQEEKQRGMTIDLGFAWLNLPNGHPVGIVDVPGHIDFIKNMVAGIGAVDTAILVIAADEGVMPQTREHLAILDLLQIESGLIAITKTDIIQDAEWLEMVQEEVREVVAGSVLAQAPMVAVSAYTGEGLDILLRTLQDVLAHAPARAQTGQPRLFIDRAFSMAGFGTIVTGTLRDGPLSVGQELIIQPGALKARIRGLQSHKQNIQQAEPGSRVAVNLTGLHPSQLHRGQVITTPGWVRSAKRVDVRLRAWEDAPTLLKHNMPITFHSGAAETPGRLRLLEADELLPGDETWAQIELRDPVALRRGDRFILRRPSPSDTLAGGVILDPAPRRRHKRRRADIFRRMAALLRNDPLELTELTITEQGPLTANALAQSLQLLPQQVQNVIDTLLAQHRAWQLAPGEELMTDAAWQRISQRLTRTLQAHHTAHPAWLGMLREELKSRVQPRQGWSTKTFNALLQRALDAGLLQENRGFLALAEFSPRFDARQQKQVEALLTTFRAHPTTPPTIKQALEIVDEELFSVLLQRGQLVRVGPDVAFLDETYQQMTTRIIAFLQQNETITMAQCRDLFNSSRKYMVALLEHLDGQRITRREGDYRVLGPAGGKQ